MTRKDHRADDLNHILDRVERMMKEGTLEELPMAAPQADADLTPGGFDHLEPRTVAQMRIDPEAGPHPRQAGAPGAY